MKLNNGVFMKRVYYVFFIYLFCIIRSFADVAYDNSLMSIGNFDNKIKIKILKPCLVGKEEFSNVVTTQNYESNEKNDNTAKEMNDLLNSIESNELNNTIDINNSNIETQHKIIKTYTNYSSEHNVNLFFNTYKKIIDNLNITNLYSISYDYDSCINITNFINNSNSHDISEYVFSEELNDNSYIISSDISITKEHEIRLDVFIWDAIDEKFLEGKYYIIDTLTTDADKLGNVVADFIFQQTTGENGGLFNSKIMYISETGNIKNRKKQVAIMNFDGSKNTKITSGNNLKLTPIFSKYNQNEVFYLEYDQSGPFIVKHNLQNNKSLKISTKKQEMTSAATFNPNGENQLIVSGSEEGKGTNLYLFDLDKKINKKLTNSKNINTCASFSPDGSKIVYVSDKTGSRKLYVKDLKTEEEKQISNGAGIYDKPSWSPDGRLIAFIKIFKGNFYLGIMTSGGEGERILASNYLIEGVRWAPNSRYLIYTKQTSPFGKGSIPKIFIMDILTRNEYQLNTPDNEGASDPDWVMNF